MAEFNLIGFRIINDIAGHLNWLDWFMVFSAEWLGYLMILFVLWLALKHKSDLKKIIILSVGSGIMARFIFAEAIRYFLYSPRPFLILENVKQLIIHDPTSSFPSGHASFYFALATGIYFIDKRTGLWFLVLAGLIGFSRIYVGVHWPLDVVAGAILGWATAVLVKRIVDKINN